MLIKITATLGAAAISDSTAKIVKKSPRLKFKTGNFRSTTILLAMVTSALQDPDPLDWEELDSAMSKPPHRERKPKKKSYKKSDSVKRLESVSGHRHRDDTANGLTRCIIEYLHHKGWQAERINTAGVPIDSQRQVTDVLGHRRTIGSVTWRRSGSTPGSADISATIRGRSVKIEVKIGRDHQSEAQRRYQSAIETAGGLYYIARDFDSFVQWYHENFWEKGGAQ